MSNEVMLTRIRLARNLKKYPFPSRLNNAGKNEVCKKIIDAVKGCNSPLVNELEVIYINDLSEAQRIALVEQHLASPEFISDSVGRAIILSKDRTMSVMINEEDHIRLQILKKGFDLDGAYESADRLDTLLDENLDFAFDEKLGYLTQCPTNLGTGMRASVMLHLPALQSNRSIDRIAANLSKLGLTIRGTYGEGSEARGAMYQLSNQVTLGISEKSAIENLKNIANQLIAQEQNAAGRIAESIEFEDRIHRALGILKNARLIDGDEAMKLLSDVRMGINAGKLSDPQLQTVDKLIADIQPATLIVNRNEKLSADKRDRIRAELIRERLNAGN